MLTVTQWLTNLQLHMYDDVALLLENKDNIQLQVFAKDVGKQENLQVI